MSLLPPQDPEALGYTSPGGTVPYPAPDPRYRPVGYWESEPTTIAWSTVSDVLSGSWNSATFDLRPDTIHARQQVDPAFKLQRLVGAQLFVAITGLLSNHLGMEVYARQIAHPTDLRKMGAVAPDVNITAQLSTGLDQAIYNVFPFAGYPIAFWRLQLRFDFVTIAPPAPLPRIFVQAGAY